MIVFFRAGRLGNQIIQYAALKSIFPSQLLILFGLDELRSFCSSEMLSVHVPGHKSIFRFFRRAFRLAGKMRLITVVTEIQIDGAYILNIKSGLIRSVRFVEESYFQHKQVTSIDLKYSIIAEAFCVNQNNGLPESKSNSYFVHVRRGDYLTWPTADSPAALPINWFMAAMDRIRRRDAQAKFLVFSDDIEYCKMNFRAHDVEVASGGTERDDLLKMASCNGGILSPSSFSWCAASAIASRWKKNSSDGGNCPILIAPKLWAGHRLGRWLPAGFESDQIEYIEVEGDSSLQD